MAVRKKYFEESSAFRKKCNTKVKLAAIKAALSSAITRETIQMTTIDRCDHDYVQVGCVRQLFVKFAISTPRSPQQLKRKCYRFEVLALMSSLRENFQFSAKDLFYLILLYRIDCVFTLSSFDFIAKKRRNFCAIKQTGGEINDSLGGPWELKVHQKFPF